MSESVSTPVSKKPEQLSLEDQFPKELIKEYFGPSHAVPSKWSNKNGAWIHHTSATSLVNIGKGTIIGPMCTFGTGAKIGENCILLRGCSVCSTAKVGNNVVLGEGVHIPDASILGDNVTVESGVCIGYGVKIGKNNTLSNGIFSKHVPDGDPYVPRTQKARGVKALKNNGFAIPEYKIIPIEDSENQLSHLVNRFARPCPMTPRHGFVDSRPIKSEKDAALLVSETKGADPNAEILVMPFIEALYSGIWTTGSITIGPGNDGATSGRESIRIPIQGHPHHLRWAELLKKAGISNQPYIELLWKAGTNGVDYLGRKESRPFETVFVQLRDGPALPSSVDFIPKKMVIRKVEIARGDLLEWESKVKELKPGTVVYHPGGSLSSHYAVHAVLSKVPVLISRKPRIGETLEPCSEVNEPNLEAVRAGFVYGCRMKSNYADAARIMMAGCHSTSLWLGKFDVLLGMAVGAACRLMMTAGLGEARHNSNNGLSGGREKIYSDAWNKVLGKPVRKKFMKAMYIFKHGSWRSGYGGKKWFELCAWVPKMYNALLAGDVKKTLENLNGAVNAVHNGGWAFNKFVAQHEFDRAASNPVSALLGVVPLLYPYINGSVSTSISAKWWMDRPKMLETGDAEKEQEEPQAALNKGTEPCECLKLDCDKCFPDGPGCDCGEHTCLDCFPGGCKCGFPCHKCGRCTYCRPDIMVLLNLDPAVASLPVNYGTVGKCYGCGGKVYLKVKTSTVVINMCVPCAYSYKAYPTAPIDSTFIPTPAAAPPAPKPAKAAVQPTATGTVVAKAQAKLLDATHLHIQYKKKGGIGHSSEDMEIPSSYMDEIKELFNKCQENSTLSKSWASELRAYVPLIKTDKGWVLEGTEILVESASLKNKHDF